jgi:hypothetical protein
MNWWRSIFRFWIVASAAWISFVAWKAYQIYARPSCFDARTDCIIYEPLIDVPVDSRVLDYLLLAFGPIFVALILGLVIQWIAKLRLMSSQSINSEFVYPNGV